MVCTSVLNSRSRDSQFQRYLRGAAEIAIFVSIHTKTRNVLSSDAKRGWYAAGADRAHGEPGADSQRRHAENRRGGGAGTAPRGASVHAPGQPDGADAQLRDPSPGPNAARFSLRRSHAATAVASRARHPVLLGRVQRPLRDPGTYSVRFPGVTMASLRNYGETINI